MISLLFILGAAVCKAVSDTISHHFYTSVFRGKNPDFWNPEYSWKVKPLPFTKYPPDAWHLFNSGMIVCFIAAAVFHVKLLPWWAELLIGGAVFNLTFNLFYNKILIK